MQEVDAAFHEEDVVVLSANQLMLQRIPMRLHDMAAATTTTTGLPANNNPTSSGTTLYRCID